MPNGTYGGERGGAHKLPLLDCGNIKIMDYIAIIVIFTFFIVISVKK